MSILGESSGFSLFGREEALLLLGDLEEPPGRFAVRLGHNTILQLSWALHLPSCAGASGRPGLQVRQGYALGALAGGHDSFFANYCTDLNF